MLRKLVWKKSAAIFVIIAAMLVALSTFWPMKLYHSFMERTGAESAESATDIVDPDMDAGEYFLAQSDHLQTVRVWIDEVQLDGRLLFSLYEVDPDTQLPVLASRGYCTVSCEDAGSWYEIETDTDVEPGQEYILILVGSDHEDESAMVTLGLSGSPDEDEASMELYEGFYNDTGLEGLHLAMQSVYRIPLSAKRTAAACCLIVLLAAAAAGMVILHYQRHGEANHLVSVGHVLQCVLTPVFLAVAGIFFIMVWPLKLFDVRPLDLIFYECGIVLTLLLGLYGLWHSREGVQSFWNGENTGRRIRQIAIAVTIACILWFCIDYMNAYAEFGHLIASGRVIIAFAVLLLIMGSAEDNLNPATVIWTIVSVIAGILIYTQNVLDPSEYAASAATHADSVRLLQDAKDLNVILGTRIAAVILLGLAAVSTIFTLVRMIRGSAHRMVRTVKWYVLLTAALFVMLFLFRNGREWIAEFVVLFTLLYIRLAAWQDRKQFLSDLCLGIILNFLLCAVFTLLHRYYPAYQMNRFSMNFYTVTETSYYLAMVEAAVMTRFVMQLKAHNDLPFKRRLAHCWKEAALFGMVNSYQLMTLTRAGIGACFVLAVLTAIVVSADRKHPVSGPLKTIGALLAATILAFPCVFTGQRILPAVVGRPVISKAIELEDVTNGLLRDVQWDSTEFMNVEVFIRDFGDRVIGGDLGTKIYTKYKWGIVQAYDTTRDYEKARKNGTLITDESQGAYSHELNESRDADGVGELWPAHSGSLTDGQVLLADADAGAAEAMHQESLDNGDFFNGRLTIYRCYLEQMNMTGHEEMGAVLPDGSLSVHAHNIFLQVSFDCGIPTGILFALFMLLTLIRSWIYYRRTRRRHAQALMPFAMTLCFGVTGMAEWIFHVDNPACMMLMLSASVLLFREH